MWKYPFFEKIVYAHQVTPFKAMSDMRLTYCDQSGNVVIFLMMILAGSLTCILDPPFLQWLQYWLPWVAYLLLLLPNSHIFKVIHFHHQYILDSKMILFVLNTWNSGTIFYITNNVILVANTLPPRGGSASMVYTLFPSHLLASLSAFICFSNVLSEFQH